MTENTCAKVIKEIGFVLMLCGIFASFVLSGFLKNNTVLGISVISLEIYEKCNCAVAVIGTLLSVLVGLLCAGISKVITSQKLKE